MGEEKELSWRNGFSKGKNQHQSSEIPPESAHMGNFRLVLIPKIKFYPKSPPVPQNFLDNNCIPTENLELVNLIINLMLDLIN